jgi:hypothetical protein
VSSILESRSERSSERKYREQRAVVYVEMDGNNKALVASILV